MVTRTVPLILRPLELRLRGAFSRLSRAFDMRRAAGMTVEVKGAVMATSSRVKAEQAKGERELAEILGEAEAEALFENRRKRDGDKAHITLANPSDAKKAVGRLPAGVSRGVPDTFRVKGVGKAESGGKVCYFLVVDWPEGRAWRESVGLDPDGQDFHITLGFGPEGDVHGVPKNRLMRASNLPMKQASLRSKLIRLANARPELRPVLLPLLKTADSFEEAVKGKTFNNPETGNKVQFGSLPSYEQEKIRGKWTERNEKKAPRKENKALKQKVFDLESDLSSPQDRYTSGEVFSAMSKFYSDDDARKSIPTIHGYPDNVRDALWSEDPKKAVDDYLAKLDSEIEKFDKVNKKEGPEQGADYSGDLEGFKDSVKDLKKKLKDGLGDFVKAKKDWNEHSDKHGLHDDGDDEDLDESDEPASKNASIRSRAIRLAYARPDLRRALLPLLKQAATGDALFDVKQELRGGHDMIEDGNYFDYEYVSLASEAVKDVIRRLQGAGFLDFAMDDDGTILATRPGGIEAEVEYDSWEEYGHPWTEVSVGVFDPNARAAAFGPIPRSVYLPKDNPTLARVSGLPEGMEVYTYERANSVSGQTYYNAVAFVGRAQKPLWNYAFKDGNQRDRQIAETAKSVEARAQMMKERSDARKQFTHGLKVGDILYSSWGYDQTNVNWFEVVDVPSEKMILVREIAGKTLSSDGYGSDKVVPTPGKYIGPVMKKIPTGRSGHVSVKIDSVQTAWKWDGKPQHETSSGWGH